MRTSLVPILLRKKAVVGSVILAADNFDRANGALGTSSHGETWVQETSGSTFAFAIASNKATSSASGTGQHCIGIGQGTYTVSCDIAPNVSGATAAGIIVKSPNTLNNCVTAFFQGTSSALRLAKVVAAAYTDLGTQVNGFDVTGATTYTLTLSVDGANNFVLKVNGVTQITGNDATFAGNWNAGIWTNGTTTSTWDNFLVVS